MSLKARLRRLEAEVAWLGSEGEARLMETKMRILDLRAAIASRRPDLARRHGWEEAPRSVPAATVDAASGSAAPAPAPAPVEAPPVSSAPVVPIERAIAPRVEGGDRAPATGPPRDRASGPLPEPAGLPLPGVVSAPLPEPPPAPPELPPEPWHAPDIPEHMQIRPVFWRASSSAYDIVEPHRPEDDDYDPFAAFYDED